MLNSMSSTNISSDEYVFYLGFGSSYDEDDSITKRSSKQLIVARSKEHAKDILLEYLNRGLDR
jgi:hypothetical protein